MTASCGWGKDLVKLRTPAYCFPARWIKCLTFAARTSAAGTNFGPSSSEPNRRRSDGRISLCTSDIQNRMRQTLARTALSRRSRLDVSFLEPADRERRSDGVQIRAVEAYWMFNFLQNALTHSAGTQGSFLTKAWLSVTRAANSRLPVNANEVREGTAF